MSCEAANIRCTYDTLSATKKKAHDAYVLMKKQEQAQRLKSADVIVAPLGQLQIVGNNSNFGPILFQVLNFPRYEPPPSDIMRDGLLHVGRFEELLIDSFFDHFNYFIPVLNRKVFMEQLRDPEQFTTSGVQKLLACVLATGSAFCQDWNDQDPSKRHPAFGAAMCCKFNELNIHDMFNSSLENCQCYLILTGYYSSATAYDKVHNLIALAHSAAASQGLNRNKGLYYQMPYKGRSHTADTIEMGHRVYWSVVIVCSIFSHDHQAPFITANDHDISFPQRQPNDKSRDFQGRERDDFDGIKHIGYFVPMYEIISRIADITNTGTKQRPHTAIDEAREELQKWRTKTLPPELRLNSPSDMDSIQKQTVFSKFNHAISYVFEICLHQTFQLHESHRERGVHGAWSRFGFDAAVGIKNIYNTHQVIRLNAHVILTIAAGAFSTAIVNNIPGKIDAALRYRDEIQGTLDGIMGSSGADADKTIRRYAGMTRNGMVKSESSINMDTTEPLPLDEHSPSRSSGSSPTHVTDMTADTDHSSDEDIGNDRGSDMEEDVSHNKRTSGHFGHQSVQRSSQQGDASRRQSHPYPKTQHRVHPSMRAKSSPVIHPIRPTPDHKQQQHKQLQPRLSQQLSASDAPGYGGMASGTPQSVGSSANSSTLVSPTFPPGYGGANNDNFSSINRPLIHHRTSSNPSLPAFSGDVARGPSDASFPNSHGMTNDHDSYMRVHQGARQHLQHQQSFSSGQHVVGEESSRPHQNSVSSTTSASSVFASNALVHDMEGEARELTQGQWHRQLSEAQMMVLQESNSVVGLDRLTLQEHQRLHSETRQRMMGLESAPPAMSSHPNGGHNDQEQFNIHSQHPHQQSSAYNEMEIPVAASLNSSQLLKGEYDGTGLMAGLPMGFGSMGEETVQDGRFCQPMLVFQMASSKVPVPSEHSSPEPPPSSQQQHQASMTASSQAGSSSMLGIMMDSQHNTDQEQQPSSAFLTTSQTLNMVYSLPQDESLLSYPFGTGMGSLVLTGGDSEFEGAGLSQFFDDPNLAEQQKMFSSVASKTMQPPPQPQPQPQHHQQRQQPPQQHHHYQHHHSPSQTLSHRSHLHQRPMSFQSFQYQGRVG
ncbi:hypothetical protein B0O80DRAFT_230393 [Mortierella sp. GBAus27b]|nr:hypothetical protein B0O80DRAFT_230393 [Mortierella sp. GBAus27b]